MNGLREIGKKDRYEQTEIDRYEKIEMDRWKETINIYEETEIGKY